MNETAKQIVTAAVVATTSVIVTAVVTHYLTKSSTLQSVAKGETPIPTPNNAGSNPTPAPPVSISDLTKLAAVAQAASEQQGWIAASWKAMLNQ